MQTWFMKAKSTSSLPESTITSKGQTTLPKEVRDALDLKAGDRVRYFIYDGEVRIAPLLPLSRLFGVLKYDGPPATLEEMDRAIAEGACRSALGSDWRPMSEEEERAAVGGARRE